MALVNQKEFAQLCEVSGKTVTTWKKAGRLVMQGSLVDVEQSVALLDRYRRGGAPAITLEGNQGNSEGNPITLEGSASDDTEPQLSNQEIELRPGETIADAAARLVSKIDVDSTSFDEARRIKEVYLALLNRLEYEQKSGSLVDLDTAGAILFEEFRAQRDAWLNWPTRVGPLMASALGMDSDKITALLAEHVHAQISQLGEPAAEFAER